MRVQWKFHHQHGYSHFCALIKLLLEKRVLPEIILLPFCIKSGVFIFPWHYCFMNQRQNSGTFQDIFCCTNYSIWYHSFMRAKEHNSISWIFCIWLFTTSNLYFWLILWIFTYFKASYIVLVFDGLRLFYLQRILFFQATQKSFKIKISESNSKASYVYNQNRRSMAALLLTWKSAYKLMVVLHFCIYTLFCIISLSLLSNMTQLHRR